MQDHSTVAQELVYFLRDYSQKKINSRLFDARRCMPPYVVLDFGRHGLLGLRTPEKYGGIGLGYRETIPVMEQLAAIDLSLTMLIAIHNGLGIGPLLANGTAAAKEELLPLLASGRMLGGMAVTEAGAGSNPRAMQGKAHLLPNGNWCLNAEKIWVGNGSWAGVLNVFVRHDGDDGRKGFAGFAVRTDQVGVGIGPEAMTTGMRSIVQNKIQFTDVEVKPEYMLATTGTTEAMFELARFGLAIVSCGALKRCAQLMLRYATRRSISTGTLVDNPVFRSNFLSVMHSIHALERLCAHIAGELDAGRPVASELFFVCKAIGPEYLSQAVDHLVQSLGGRGYMESNDVPQLMRDARLLRIFEGPTETMRAHLGAMWRGGAYPLRSLLSQGLHGTSILARITLACDDIWESSRPVGNTPGQHIFARNAAIGEVVAEGTMWWWACSGPTQPQLAGWAQARFEDACLRGRSSTRADLEFDLDFCRAELERAIGSGGQFMPGEDWALDPLLDAR